MLPSGGGEGFKSQSVSDICSLCRTNRDAYSLCVPVLGLITLVPRDTRRAIYVAAVCLKAIQNKTTKQNRNTIQAPQFKLGDNRLLSSSVDCAGKSTRALFAILFERCLFRVYLCIILCVTVGP